MDGRLLQIVELVNYLSAGCDESCPVTIDKRRSRIIGFRKQIIADCIAELHNPGKGFFDERTLSYLKLCKVECNRERILKLWEIERLGDRISRKEGALVCEGDIADEMFEIGKDIYFDLNS